MPEGEVSAFRCKLLETLIKSPADQEQPAVIRDKLLFLQELFYAKCISEDEYHSSKRPLLQRLAVQGAEIGCKDVIVSGLLPPGHLESEEEWSDIDFKDEQCLIDNDSLSKTKNKAKYRSPLKQIKGAASSMGIKSTSKLGKSRGTQGTPNSTAEPLCLIDLNCSPTNNFVSFNEKANRKENQSILMPECSPPPSNNSEKERGTEKVKKKAFRSLFQKELSEESSGGYRDSVSTSNEKAWKSAKKQWGFDALKRWKRSNAEDESTMPYLQPGERSDYISSSSCVLVASPIGEGPNTKLIKKKIHSDGSASDFFIDKVLGENIKTELLRIQMELSTTNPTLSFSNEQIEAISTRLPVDKAELKKFFPKSWCDRYGDVVLDVVRKEFKDHVAAREKQKHSSRWVSFEDDDGENFHPNLFFHN